jgi:hypothetical protein
MNYLNGIDDDILDDSIKLEPIGLKKIELKNQPIIQQQLVNTNSSSIDKEKKSGLGTWLSKESTGELFGSALEVFSAIKGQREASGKTATRQDRITQCGRRPLRGLNAKGLSKQRYDKCVQELQLGTTTIQGGNMGGYDGSKSMQNEGGGTKYLWWVLGGVAVIGLGFFAIKKFGKQ